MQCVGIGYCIEKTKVRLLDQAKTSVFICQNFVSLKIVVQILFVVKGVFPKDLEPMLCIIRSLFEWRVRFL